MSLKKSDIPLANHFVKKPTIILIPQGINAPSFTNQFPISFYELSVHGFVFQNNDIDKALLIYAPSLIGTWLLYKSSWKKSANTKLLIDKNAIINYFNKAFIELYLTYEKLRLGSDVPSPFITRILQREGYYPHLKNVNIGQWLACIRATKIYDDRVLII